MSVTALNRLSARDLLSASVLVLIWGLNFVAIKIGLPDFTPFQLGAGRFLLSFLPLALWIRPPPIGLHWLLGYGLLQGIGQFGALFLALKVGMPTAPAPVMMQMQVFVTAGLASAMLGERISKSLRVAMLVAAAGLACFAVNAIRPAEGGTLRLLGRALNLLAASLWAGSNIVVRKLQRQGVSYSVLSQLVWSGAISAAGFAALSALFNPASVRGTWAGASWQRWLAVLYLGWGANVLAHWLWTSLLTRHPASRVAPFSLGCRWSAWSRESSCSTSG